MGINDNGTKSKWCDRCLRWTQSSTCPICNQSDALFDSPTSTTPQNLVIKKERFIELLTKSGQFGKAGVSEVLEKSGFEACIEAMMISLDSAMDARKYYHDKCNRLEEDVKDLESWVDKLEAKLNE